MVHPDPRKLQDAANYTEAVIDDGIDTSNARALAEIRNALRRVEKVAKEARREVVEPALDEEVDVGDSVAGVQRIERSRPEVTDNATALQMLEDAGADPAEVIKIFPGQFTDAVDGANVDPSEVVEYTESTQYRRTD